MFVKTGPFSLVALEVGVVKNELCLEKTDINLPVQSQMQARSSKFQI